MDMLAVGNRIRKRREELNITREVLAKKLEITPKFCADIECGVRGFSLKTLEKLTR